MTTTDVLLVLATALSPLIAVQVSKYLERKAESRNRKMHIFRVLMATRAYNLAFGHVEALNSIELEFSTKNRKEKAVIDAWQAYLDHLGQKEMEAGEWVRKRVDLISDMLHAMALCLGYDFSKTQIKNGVYSPTAHGKLDQDADRLRELAIEFLEGKRIVPVGVTSLANDGQTANTMASNTEAAIGSTSRKDS